MILTSLITSMIKQMLMKIYAFYLKVVQDGKLTAGIFFKVGSCMKTAERELIKKLQLSKKHLNKNVRIEAGGSMTFSELARKMEPRLEDMIKQAKDKDKLLDVIRKLPIE